MNKQVNGNPAAPGKTRSSFYRRLYTAWLISQGYDTVPEIIRVTGMPRRTAQDTISALEELDIKVRFSGARKNGRYQLEDWGAVNSIWVENNLARIRSVLGYPETD